MSYKGLPGFQIKNDWDVLKESTPIIQDQGIFSLGNFSSVAPVTPTAPAATSGWNWLGSTDAKTGVKTPGMLDYGIGALSGLGNLFMGMQNYGLAKDQLKFQKDAYNKNYAAQAKTTNASLEDRQAARVASNPTAYASVSDYMAKNRIV